MYNIKLMKKGNNYQFLKKGKSVKFLQESSTNFKGYTQVLENPKNNNFTNVQDGRKMEII